MTVHMSGINAKAFSIFWQECQDFRVINVIIADLSWLFELRTSPCKTEFCFNQPPPPLQKNVLKSSLCVYAPDGSLNSSSSLTVQNSSYVCPSLKRKSIFSRRWCLSSDCSFFMSSSSRRRCVLARFSLMRFSLVDLGVTTIPRLRGNAMHTCNDHHPKVKGECYAPLQ